MMSRIKTYSKDKDYMALIEQAAGAGDYRRAAMLEQQRNAKSKQKGKDFILHFGSYLPCLSFSASGSA